MEGEESLFCVQETKPDTTLYKTDDYENCRTESFTNQNIGSIYSIEHDTPRVVLSIQPSCFSTTDSTTNPKGLNIPYSEAQKTKPLLNISIKPSSKGELTIFKPVHMPVNPTMSTEIIGLSFEVYYGTRALTDKEKDSTTKDIQKQSCVIYQVKVESHVRLEDESVRTVVIIENIPIFWQLHNSVEVRDRRNQRSPQHRFYKHKKIEFFSNSNESKKIIEILPLFVLTNKMRFFKDKYVKKINAWVCSCNSFGGKRKTIRHTDNEQLADIYKIFNTHSKKVNNEKAPLLRNVLRELKNQEKDLENCQASSYSVFNEVVTKLKGLDIHLK
ncbi:hypothetical protein CDIK_4385, partial [Cucumispora dikerogammari]